MIEQREHEFVQAFWTRRAVAAYSVFAFNIIVYLLMTLAGGSENPSTLVAFGAKTNLRIDQGEIWRFVTPMFLHIGFLHLLFNSYALWIVGPQVEKLYGSARFFLLYVLTGIAGVAGSYLYTKHPEAPSAGASGALFGMFGVLLVFSFKYRKIIPAFFSQALGRGILWTLAINLGISFLPGIDAAAHIGGLIAGCLLALVVPFIRPRDVEWRALKVVQYALVALIGFCFFEVALHYDGPSFSFQNLRQGTASTEEFASTILLGQIAFEESETVLGSGEFRQLPRVRENLGEAIDALNNAPPFSGRANELQRDLLDVLRKQYAYVQEVEDSGRARTDFMGVSPQTTRYGRLKLRIMNWFEEQGLRYRNVR